MLRLQRGLAAIAWRWRCRRAALDARRVTLAALEAWPARRVLVVCYGNIYRSPFVAERLRQACGDTIQVRSGGFHPLQGRPSPERHIAASLNYGVDLAAHRSAVVGADDIKWADLVVLMDRHNWQSLMQMGAHPDRFVWLGALDGGPVEIPDPYTMGDAEAEAVLRRLSTCSGRLAGKLDTLPSRAADAAISARTGAGATRGG